jgi:hypothetical protein
VDENNCCETLGREKIKIRTKANKNSRCGMRRGENIKIRTKANKNGRYGMRRGENIKIRPLADEISSLHCEQKCKWNVTGKKW